MSYTYGEIENAMRHVAGIKDEEFPAFKSKIRHFRTLNIPAVDRPGTGSRTVYEGSHALELAIGLALADFGVRPKWLRGLVTHSVRALQTAGRDEVFNILGSQGIISATICGRKNLAAHVADTNVVGPYAVLNLSHIAKSVHQALS